MTELLFRTLETVGGLGHHVCAANFSWQQIRFFYFFYLQFLKNFCYTIVFLCVLVFNHAVCSTEFCIGVVLSRRGLRCL